MSNYEIIEFMPSSMEKFTIFFWKWQDENREIQENLGYFWGSSPLVIRTASHNDRYS